MQNLFLAGENEPAKPTRALTHLARTIARIQADVLCLQEVGSLASLELLNQALKNPYPYVALLPGNSNRSIHLGYLSRLPVSLTSHRHLALQGPAGEPLLEYSDEVQAHAGASAPLKIQRDILQAELTLGEHRMILLNVHLKSRSSRCWNLLATDQVRIAEARLVAQHIQSLQRDAQHLLALVGDFNDTWYSDALAPIRELALHDPLREALAAAGRNPSTYWPKRRNRIDFILLNDAAAKFAGSASIGAHDQARIASDHYPVLQELHLPVNPSI